MRAAILRAGVLVVALGLCACTQAPIRLYTGPAREAATLALVSMPEQLEIAQINGVEVPAASGMGSKGDKLLELAPGRYDLLLYYRELWVQGDNQDVVRSDPVRVVAELAAGHRYRIDYPQPRNLDEANALALEFSASIGDQAGGERIVSEPSGLTFRGGLLAQIQGDRKLVQAVQREQGQQVITPLEPGVATGMTATPARTPAPDDQLLLVKAWWNQASAEQRRAFLEWAAAPR